MCVKASNLKLKQNFGGNLQISIKKLRLSYIDFAWPLILQSLHNQKE